MVVISINEAKFVPILESFTLINMVYCDLFGKIFVELSSIFALQKAYIQVNL